MSRFDLCAFPRCERASAAELDQPICGHHAREVYLAVKDRLDAATIAERAAAAGRGGRPFRNHRDTPGLVYFARIGERVKIGFTTNLGQRMQDLGATDVLGVMPGTRVDEREMHVKFRRSWLGGEFFSPTDDLLDFAASLPGA